MSKLELYSTLRKRITSLILAVLMALAVVSTIAAAVVDDEGIMPLAEACPDCRRGYIRTRLASEVPGAVKVSEKLQLLSIWRKQMQGMADSRCAQRSKRLAERHSNQHKSRARKQPYHGDRLGLGNGLPKKSRDPIRTFFRLGSYM